GARATTDLVRGIQAVGPIGHSSGDASALRSPSYGLNMRRGIHGIWSLSPGTPGFGDLIKRLTIGETLRDDCASPDIISNHPDRRTSGSARAFRISVPCGGC